MTTLKKMAVHFKLGEIALILRQRLLILILLNESLMSYDCIHTYHYHHL